MRILLDTHVLLWSLEDSVSLGKQARGLLVDADNAVLVSVASLWEITIKVRIGKLRVNIGDVEAALDSQGFERLGIDTSHLLELSALPLHHRDPFDHLLIAQTRSEGLVLMTADKQIAQYPVDRIAADR